MIFDTVSRISGKMPSRATRTRGRSSEEPAIRVGFRTVSTSKPRLQFIRQLGVTDVFLGHTSHHNDSEEPNDAMRDDTLIINDDTIPTVDDLIEVRERVEANGLRLTGIHTLPNSLYGPIMFGTEQADERIRLIAELLRNLGSADIPILGYQWNPRGLVPMRTRTDKPIRGGAEVTEFNLNDIQNPFEVADTVDREYTEEEFWANYRRFAEEVVPVAEKAGVRMALHPTDPPGIRQLGGIPRLFRNIEGFDRAMEIVPSYYHGLKLCLGCFSQLDGDVVSVIKHFGERDQIVFVHFRDVVGTVPRFHETFVDSGNYDEYEAMLALDKVGFEGPILPDHVPRIEGDSEWSHRAKAFTAGYLKGLINAIQR